MTIIRSPRRAARRLSSAGAVASGVMLLVSLFATPTQTVRAAPIDGGAVEIRTTDGQPLTAGGSATVFLLVPPAEASCPGSGSGTPPYRWQMYMVDSGVDVSTLTYLNGPQPVAGHTVLKVYDAGSQTPVVNKNPAANPLGLITGIPSVSFAVFTPGVVPAGDYKVGFACTLAGQTVTYWTAGIAVTTDPADQPAGFTFAPKVLAAPVNNPPVAADDTANAQAGAGPVAIDVRVNDNDPDGDALAVVAVTQGSKGTSAFTATGVTYSASAAASGTDTFTYTVSDGVLTATATVTVTIAAVSEDSSTTSTTSTTIAGQQTSTTAATTSTTSPGSTTSTPESATSTTRPATPVFGTPTTARPDSAGTSGTLAATGTPTTQIIIWAVLLLVFGRMAVLLSRPVRARTSRR